MASWGAAIPVIVAVISVIGAAFLPPLAESSIINQLNDAPDIKIHTLQFISFNVV
jgi:Cu/Ag efflux pump CusA